jgi:Ca2+-binding EF-hand superfamily protein
MADKDIEELISSRGKNVNQKGIDYSVFEHVMQLKLNNRGSKQEITRIFNILDVENKGRLTLTGLKKVAAEIGRREGNQARTYRNKT